MSADGIQLDRRKLTFVAWKELLRNDCIVLGKLGAFNGLGEIVLKILYENGVDPTVDAIVQNGLHGPNHRAT